MYFSIKYRYSDILLKKKHNNIDFIYYHSFWCNHTCYCVCMAFVTSASRYVTSASHYQSRTTMYIRGLISRTSRELAEAVPIDSGLCIIALMGIHATSQKEQSTILVENSKLCLIGCFTFSQQFFSLVEIQWTSIEARIAASETTGRTSISKYYHQSK